MEGRLIAVAGTLPVGMRRLDQLHLHMIEIVAFQHGAYRLEPFALMLDGAPARTCREQSREVNGAAAAVPPQSAYGALDRLDRRFERDAFVVTHEDAEIGPGPRSCREAQQRCEYGKAHRIRM